ncbi:hypothetical protein [Bifidobacterium panos]|uniref:Cell division protein Fic n=1 Tax=Bifidobacterium panos TaxID=2675321 RepID=A0ABX1SYI6_9BIFI|nr:hypothetical protein [Bifidobacterium sp. DSM 109963]NMN01856.1 cell division protein Fic [Bifidobacterium sp. DSM 109963]
MGERIVERLIRERDAGYSNGIYAATQVWFAWNSNHMEGSTLTPEQTAQIFAADTIALDGTERVRVDNAFKRDITVRAKERLASLQDDTTTCSGANGHHRPNPTRNRARRTQPTIRGRRWGSDLLVADDLTIH